MNLVQPFKAIRPKEKLTATFVSYPFDFYTHKEVESILSKSPNSFLKIIHSKNNNSLVGKKNKFNEFLKKDILIKDNLNSFYIYSQSIHGKEYTGIIAATNTVAISNGILKTHEKTLITREKKLKDYLKVVDINAEPVSLAYKNSNELSAIIAKTKSIKPNLKFTTRNNTIHKLWIVNKDNLVNKIRNAFNKLTSFYIADGHHRSAASLRLAQELQKGKSHNSNFFLSIFFNANEIDVHSFNRVILLKKEPKHLMPFLKKKFKLYKKSESTKVALNKNEFGMYIKNQWYNLIPKIHYDLTDSEILDTHVLPLLNLTSQSKNIKYISAVKGNAALEKKVEGHTIIAFKLHPLTFNDVIKISNKGRTLPPKSTWIEPKLLSGLTILNLDINE